MARTDRGADPCSHVRFPDTHGVYWSRLSHWKRERPLGARLRRSDWLRSFPLARRMGVVGIDDEQLRQLASMRGLRHLELSETNVLGEGLKHLCACPNSAASDSSLRRSMRPGKSTSSR